MLSAVLTRPHTIEIQEREIPEPGPGEVRVKVAAVGICGSDVHYYAEGRIGVYDVIYPTLLGHEPSGIIDKAGAGTTLKPGTRVAIEPAHPCGQCRMCRMGKGHLCPNVRFLGTPPIEGIFEQYHVIPEETCIPIPDEMSLVEAALLEPLGVALHALKLARLEVGEDVAIFGAGPIGLVTLLAARAAGASRVFMTDLVPERRQFALELGATDVMDPREGDVLEWLKGHTDGWGVDATFEAAGAAETVAQACLGTRPAGRALIIGIPSERDLVYPVHIPRNRELTLQYVRRSNREADTAIDMVTAGRINLGALATHFFPIDRAGEAMDLVHARQDGVIKAILQPNPDLV